MIEGGFRASDQTKPALDQTDPFERAPNKTMRPRVLEGRHEQPKVSCTLKCR